MFKLEIELWPYIRIYPNNNWNWYKNRAFYWNKTIESSNQSDVTYLEWKFGWEHYPQQLK